MKTNLEWFAERSGWPKTTPTGHIYKTPTTYDEVRARGMDFVQGWAEHWDESEMPPNPTWDMLGLAHREVDRLEKRVQELEQELCPHVVSTIYPSGREWCDECGLALHREEDIDD